jgi:hypothetical protein
MNRLFFSAFLNRDRTFTTLEQLWKVAMSHLLKIAEVEVSTLGKPGEAQSFANALPVNRLAELISSKEEPSSPMASPGTPTKKTSLFFIQQEAAKDVRAQLATSSTKYIMEKQSRNDLIYDKFRIQNEEPIVNDYRVFFWFNNIYEAGWIFLTPNFLSYGNPKLKFIIPWKYVCEISKRNVISLAEAGIEVITLNSQSFFFKMGSSQRDNIYKQMFELYSVNSSPIAPITAPPNLKKSRDQYNLGTRIFEDKTNFSEDYVQKQEALVPFFDEYLKKYAIGDFSLIQTVEFHRSVRDGIPDCYRGHIWKVCSGAIQKSIVSEKSFEAILKEYEGKSSIYTDMISRDLHRSLPEHPYYQSPIGIKALENVLNAYSWRNQIIGYCQAMNYIAATLLLFMDEASAFWTLASICEDIVPANYRPQMLGTLLEQKIFEFLLEYYMPDVSNHFKECDVPVAVITAQWFLCLFIGYVPLEVAFCVLDRWFCVNTDALFQVGLALIKMRKQDLLKARRVEQFSFVFKDYKYTPNALLEHIPEFYGLPRDQMNEIKNEHQYALIQSLHDSAKTKKMLNLARNTQFTKTEIQPIVEFWQSYIPISSTMDFVTFTKIYPNVFRFWSELPDVPSKLFGCLIPEESGGDLKLTIENFIQGLNIIFKGKLLEQWDLCCNMYGVKPRSSTCTKRQLVPIINTFLRLYISKNSVGVLFEPDIEAITLFIEEKAILSPSEENLILLESIGSPKHILDYFQLSETSLETTFQQLLDHLTTSQTPSKHLSTSSQTPSKQHN